MSSYLLIIVLCQYCHDSQKFSLRKKCPYSALFWSACSRIRTEYEEIWSICPYSARMRENAQQNKSEYGHFSRSAQSVYNRVYDFLTENKILYEKQFGFQSSHSSEHTILQLSNRTNYFNEKPFTLRTFYRLFKSL